MSNLTNQQLIELTERINARLAEFGDGIFSPTSPGVVRLAYGVIAEWQEEIVPALKASTADDDDLPAAAYAVGYERGKQAERANPKPVDDTPRLVTQSAPAPLSASAAAALGPEHTIVTPLANGNGTHKASRDERIQRELGNEPPNRDSHLPTKVELLREIKRIAMAGMMPSQAAFDAAKPATWATAQAHTKRLGVSWTELAEEAGLTLRRGPSNTESNP